MSEQEKRLFDGKLTEQDLTERETIIRIPQKPQFSGEQKLEPGVIRIKGKLLTIIKDGQILYTLSTDDIKRVKTQLGAVYLITKQGTKLITFDDGEKNDQALGAEMMIWAAIFKHAGIKTSGLGKPVLLAILFLIAFLGWLVHPFVSFVAIALFIFVTLKR